MWTSNSVSYTPANQGSESNYSRAVRAGWLQQKPVVVLVVATSYGNTPSARNPLPLTLKGFSLLTIAVLFRFTEHRPN